MKPNIGLSEKNLKSITSVIEFVIEQIDGSEQDNLLFPFRNDLLGTLRFDDLFHNPITRIKALNSLKMVKKANFH